MVILTYDILIAQKGDKIIELYRVCFAGHKKSNNYSYIEDKLNIIISNLLESKEYVEFFIGDNGEFDTIATSVIRHNRKKYGTYRCAVNLVLPYRKANILYYESQFDSVIIPKELYGIHYKKAITMRNYRMIDNSDLLICYVEQTHGWAYIAMQYAENIGINVLNIADNS